MAESRDCEQPERKKEKGKWTNSEWCYPALDAFRMLTEIPREKCFWLHVTNKKMRAQSQVIVGVTQLVCGAARNPAKILLTPKVQTFPWVTVFQLVLLRNASGPMFTNNNNNNNNNIVRKREKGTHWCISSMFMHMPIISMFTEREKINRQETQQILKQELSCLVAALWLSWWPDSTSLLLRSGLFIQVFQQLFTPAPAWAWAWALAETLPGELLIPGQARQAKAFTAPEPWNGAKSGAWSIGRRLLHPCVGRVFQLSPWRFKRGWEDSLLTEKPLLSTYFLLSLVNTLFFCIEKPEQNTGVNFVTVSLKNQRPARLFRSQQRSGDCDFYCVFANTRVFCLCMFTYKIIVLWTTFLHFSVNHYWSYDTFLCLHGAQ